MFLLRRQKSASFDHQHKRRSFLIQWKYMQSWYENGKLMLLFTTPCDLTWHALMICLHFLRQQIYVFLVLLFPFFCSTYLLGHQINDLDRYFCIQGQFLVLSNSRLLGSILVYSRSIVGQFWFVPFWASRWFILQYISSP